MLKIRFFRIGKKKQPSFKIVVTDQRRPPSGGRFVEEVGFLNPLTKEKNLKVERIKHWISKGAKPSDSVYNLLIKEKVLEGKKIPVHKKKKEKKESVATPAPEVKPKAEKKEEPKETKLKEKKEEIKPEEAKTEEKKKEKVEEKKAEEPKQEVKEKKKEEVQPEEKKEEKSKETI